MVDYDENEAENEIEMKNRFQRYDMNRPRATHGNKYTK